MSTTGENEQPRAVVTSPAADATAGTPADGFDWQSELESALTDLDGRLLHPRRHRVSPGRPAESTPVHLTSEVLDEIARRVSQHIRRNQAASLSTESAQTAIASSDAAQPPIFESPRQMPSGIALTIRVRRPLFRWRFWRRPRRRQAMMLFSDFRVS